MLRGVPYQCNDKNHRGLVGAPTSIDDRREEFFPCRYHIVTYCTSYYLTHLMLGLGAVPARIDTTVDVGKTC
jgi:hypothetical protein